MEKKDIMKLYIYIKKELFCFHNKPNMSNTCDIKYFDIFFQAKKNLLISFISYKNTMDGKLPVCVNVSQSGILRKFISIRGENIFLSSHNA